MSPKETKKGHLNIDKWKAYSPLPKKRYVISNTESSKRHKNTFYSYAEILLSSLLCSFYVVTHKCSDSGEKTAHKYWIFFLEEV